MDELIQVIAQARRTFPHLRLGQLLLNAADERNLYHLTDEQLVYSLKRYIKEHSK